MADSMLGMGCGRGENPTGLLATSFRCHGPLRSLSTGACSMSISLDIPGTDTTASEGEIPFNTCLTTAGQYVALVHEAGHALGISYGPDIVYPNEQDRFHPKIRDALMSYHPTPDCSPHPFDIMAIYALYQTVD